MDEGGSDSVSISEVSDGLLVNENLKASLLLLVVVMVVVMVL